MNWVECGAFPTEAAGSQPVAPLLGFSLYQADHLNRKSLGNQHQGFFTYSCAGLLQGQHVTSPALGWLPCGSVATSTLSGKAHLRSSEKMCWPLDLESECRFVLFTVLAGTHSDFCLVL